MTRTRTQRRNFILYCLMMAFYCITGVANVAKGNYEGAAVIIGGMFIILVALQTWRKEWQGWLGT